MTAPTATLSDRLEELGKAATQGEWRTTGVRSGHKGDIYAPTGTNILDSHWVARCFAPLPEKSPACDLQVRQMTNEAIAQIEANAEQIVLLHNNLDTIISALRSAGL